MLQVLQTALSLSCCRLVMGGGSHREYDKGTSQAIFLLFHILMIHLNVVEILSICEGKFQRPV